MGRLIITIGAGKNGTHTMATAMQAGGFVSSHQPEPRLHREAVLFYSGMIDPIDVRSLWVYDRLAQWIRNILKVTSVLHLADCGLTMFAALLRRDFDATIIGLRRRDTAANVASWMVHGAYVANPWFIAPRQADLRRLFISKFSQVEKCAWYVRQTNRITEKVADVVIDTEDLSESWPTICEATGLLVPHNERLVDALHTKHGATSPAAILKANARIAGEYDGFDAVMQGQYDEPIPEAVKHGVR